MLCTAGKFVVTPLQFGGLGMWSHLLHTLVNMHGIVWGEPERVAVVYFEK